MADASSLIATLEAHAETLARLGHTVRFDLTDTGDAILLDATGSELRVVQSADPAEAVFKLSTDTLDKLMTRRLGPMLAFTTGRLRIEGSQGVALKLAGLLGS